MNMLDYLKWRGDLSFKQCKYSIADCFLICYMAYVDFTDIIPEKGDTVKNISDRFFDKHSMEEVINSKSFIGQAPLVLKAMAESERFRNCRVYNYANVLNKEYAEQFSAITVDLPDSPSVIAFRGTDDTLVGWKEDLMMSYSDIPSQLDAYLYLKDNVKMFRKYIVCGHSKGGNLAQYAVLNSDKNLQGHIEQFISFDGPGVTEEMFGDPNSSINQRFLKVVPEFDVFGTIYDNDCKRMIVKSSEFGVMCHSGFSWQMVPNGFETVEEPSRYTKYVKEAFTTFINETTIEQRSNFVEQFFLKLKEADYNNLSEVSKGGISGFYGLLKSVANTDEETKKTGGIFLKIFADAMNNGLAEIIDLRKDDVIKLLHELKDSTKDFISRSIKQNKNQEES